MINNRSWKSPTGFVNCSTLHSLSAPPEALESSRQEIEYNVKDKIKVVTYKLALQNNTFIDTSWLVQLHSSHHMSWCFHGDPNTWVVMGYDLWVIMINGQNTLSLQHSGKTELKIESEVLFFCLADLAMLFISS